MTANTAEREREAVSMIHRRLPRSSAGRTNVQIPRAPGV